MIHVQLTKQGDYNTSFHVVGFIHIPVIVYKINALVMVLYNDDDYLFLLQSLLNK